MILSKQTLSVLKCLANINTNLVIKAGTKISSVSASKDILVEYDGEDDFEKNVSLFNLNEFLGVISAFSNPELDLDDKFVTIKEGKQKVKYVYADETLLTVPPAKAIVMPTPEVTFNLPASYLQRIQKMAGVLSVDNLSFIGDGKKIIARVFASDNPTGNTFDIDLETKSAEKFNVQLKVEKLKLYSDIDYKVELSSKKISRFTAETPKIVFYLAIETTSTFG